MAVTVYARKLSLFEVPSALKLSQPLWVPVQFERRHWTSRTRRVDFAVLDPELTAAQASEHRYSFWWESRKKGRV
eukprot:63902-Rhodomonas_salina.1